MEWKKGVISGIIAGLVMLLIGLVFMMIPFTPGLTQWYSVTFCYNQPDAAHISLLPYSSGDRPSNP